METRIGFQPELRFPTKASMKFEVRQQQSRAVSNHFEVSLEEGSKNFYEWHIGFFMKVDMPRFLEDPTSVAINAISDDSRHLIFEVLKANRKEVYERIGRNFSTGVTLYSVEKTDLKSAYFTEHNKYVLLIEMKNDVNTIKSLTESQNSRFQLLRFLNSSIKGMFSKMDFIELGRNKKYYNPKNVETVRSGEHRFLILKGFKTAFEIYEGGLKLMVDYSTRVIREQSLWEEVLKYRQQNQPDEDIIDSVIKGRSVMTIYGNQRIYRVDEVLRNGRVTDPFPDPTYKNFADYFENRYKLKIRFRDQFMLVHHKTIVDKDAKGNVVSRRIEKVVLIPELVRATGLTDEMRSDFRIMKDIGVHTILNPENRFQEITGVIKRLNKSKPNGFNFQINSSSNEISALQLKAPRILMGKDASENPQTDRINLRDLAESRALDNWVLVYEPFCEKNIDCVIENFHKSCKRFNIKFSDPGEVIPIDRKDRAEDIDRKIQKSKRTPDPDIIFFFISRRSANSTYKEMKKYFNGVGIITQFFVSFNPNKDSVGLSKYGNLLLQMVNKMGCNLWYVDRVMKQSLVLGADVYHAKNNKSVAAVVGQYDKYFRESYSVAHMQSREYQEIMKYIASMVIDQVENYIKANKEPPKDIIFYRDGVGEGQIDEVMKVEIKSIEDSLAEAYGNKKPGLIFIVVTKRVDDRFATGGQGLRNPDAGLIVVNDVVKPQRANFFMIAQRVTQGTANPTHYDIIYNSTDIKLNDLISLTFELAWGYSNWLGPVKVPAPVQYAKKLCTLIGITQDAKVNKNLRSTRYYM
jgi:aubergine-like protein